MTAGKESKQPKGERKKPDKGERKKPYKAESKKPVKGAVKKPVKVDEAATLRKLMDYALNPDHPQGGPKSVYFRESLGYTRDNAADLAAQLQFDVGKAKQSGKDKYGIRYNQDITVVSADGKKSRSIKTAWIEPAEGTPIRLVTIYPA